MHSVHHTNTHMHIHMQNICKFSGYVQMVLECSTSRIRKQQVEVVTSLDQRAE